jgi:hypothetical protein
MKLMHDASVISGNASKALKQRLLTALDPLAASRIGTPHRAKPPGPIPVLIADPSSNQSLNRTVLVWYATCNRTGQVRAETGIGKSAERGGTKKGPCTNAFADGPLVHCKPKTTGCERQTAIYEL